MIEPRGLDGRLLRASVVAHCFACCQQSFKKMYEKRFLAVRAWLPVFAMVGAAPKEPEPQPASAAAAAAAAGGSKTSAKSEAKTNSPSKSTGNGKDDFIPSKHYEGSKPGYYFSQVRTGVSKSARCMTHGIVLTQHSIPTMLLPSSFCLFRRGRVPSALGTTETTQNRKKRLRPGIPTTSGTRNGRRWTSTPCSTRATTSDTRGVRRPPHVAYAQSYAPFIAS